LAYVLVRQLRLLVADEDGRHAQLLHQIIVGSALDREAEWRLHGHRRSRLMVLPFNLKSRRIGLRKMADNQRIHRCAA